MAKEVYANGNAIAGKFGGGKVIAAFPDVCNSPPPPPAGPIPLPYPNSSTSGDLKKGSKTVKIGKKPVALQDQSFYKTTPLGDEAATKSFGASLLSHTNAGKTYFAAYSMDVVFEGKKVCRHLDLTTSNHGSYPGSTPPFPDMEKMIQLALKMIAKDKCPCCGKGKHVLAGEPMNRDEWYEDGINNSSDKLQPEIWRKGEKIQSAVTVESRKAELKALLEKASDSGRKKAGCKCHNKKPKTEVLPKPPCDVFYKKDPADTDRVKTIEEAWKNYKPLYSKQRGVPTEESQESSGVDAKTSEAKKKRQVNHLTPKSAGGCPGNQSSNGNLQPHHELCSVCQEIDDQFSAFQ